MRSLLVRMPLSMIVAALVPLCNCTTSVQVTGGSSSETVIGRVYNSDGSPASSTIVTLYPANFNPITDVPRTAESADTTDSDGNYSIKKPDSTEDYSLIAANASAGTKALVTGIVVNRDTTSVQDAILTLPGSVRVAVPDSAAGGYLYIPGTGIAVTVQGDGMVFIGEVPSGTVPSVNYVSATAPEDLNVLTTNLQVVSTDTLIIPYPQWRYSSRAYFNTTVSGANVTRDVADFPVLIRLTDKTFNFSEALPDGKDVRFTDALGVPLHHELEQWDALAGRAVVWVRVPVVYGNSSNQYVTMHWGTSLPNVSSQSDGATVFDTATGFQAVWHLDGAVSGSRTVLDATANEYFGTAINMDAASVVSGLIGDARDFDGVTGYIDIPNSASGHLDMPQNSNFALSCWVYADTIDSLWHLIAGKGHEQYYLKLKCSQKNKSTWEFVEFQDQKGWAHTEDSIPTAPGAGAWVYLTGVRSGTQQWLYINGQMASDSVPLMDGNYLRIRSDNFSIGRNAREVTIPYSEGWGYFDGKIDEVRVMNRALEESWIRLCYMNQQSVDKLVTFR